MSIAACRGLVTEAFFFGEPLVITISCTILLTSMCESHVNKLGVSLCQMTQYQMKRKVINPNAEWLISACRRLIKFVTVISFSPTHDII